MAQRYAESPLFRKLKDEHTAVAGLMEEISSVTGDERKGMFAKIHEQLLAHAKAEEAKLYAELLRHEATREVTEKAIGDHQDVEDLLEEIASMSVSDSDWMASFKTLKAMFYAHVYEEESQIFPSAAKVLNEDQLAEIEHEYDDEEQRYLKRFENVEHRPPAH